MHGPVEQVDLKVVVDEYGNFHKIADELARGGQGVVYRTKDADLAIKQPLNASGQPDKNTNLSERFQRIRLLPIPLRIPVSLPLAILRDEPGYVMRLLNDMKSFTAFDLDARSKRKFESDIKNLPQWLEEIPNRDLALRLLHYSSTGSTRRRLRVLAKCAAILARLHSAGIIYGDISPNNAFFTEGNMSNVWLIDADNMRPELLSGGASVYTPGYGAPEIVRRRGESRPRTDCWAFAVMAFKLLAMCHPFIGKKVLQAEEAGGGWDAEPPESDEAMPASMEDQAYAGYLAFVDDDDDNSNEGTVGLPRTLVTTPGLRRLFQATFGVGREHPQSRPTMAFWALELTKAADRGLDCPECAMSYFPDDHGNCPYCGGVRPPFVRVQTPRWQMCIPASRTEFALPHRLFHPFSFEKHDNIEYDSVLNFSAKTVAPARGADPFPEVLTFRFVEGAK